MLLGQRVKATVGVTWSVHFSEVGKTTNPVDRPFKDIESCERMLYAIIAHLYTEWETKPLKKFARNA
jgi:hypothetical protein